MQFIILIKMDDILPKGNDIYELASDSFRGLEDSLQTLILADNAISSLPPGAFSELRALEILDMRGNTLQYLDAAALPPKLQHLSLADNLITSMPVRLAKMNKRHNKNQIKCCTIRLPP